MATPPESRELPARPSTFGRLLRKFLPLSLSDVVMALGDPLQTMALSRLPSPHETLAGVGVVKAVAAFLESPIIMLLHASTALSARAVSRRALFRFMLLMSALLTGIFVLLALRPVYDWLFAHVFGVGRSVATTGRSAFLLMCLWPAVIAWRRFYQGLLIRRAKSKCVGWASVCRLGWLASVFSLGVAAKLDGALLAGAALIGGALVEAVAVTLFARRLDPSDPQGRGVENPSLCLPGTLPGVARYYVPLASTMLFVWGGRAALLGVIARASDALLALAAWPAAWGLVLSVANATRMVQQVVIASAEEDTRSHWLRFVFVVGSACSAVVLFLGFSSTGMRLLGQFLGDDRELTTAALPVVRIAAAFPLLLAYQNALQGLLIRAGKTWHVNGATLVSVAAMLATSSFLVSTGYPGATSAACAMVAGVALEIALLLALEQTLVPRSKTT